MALAKIEIMEKPNCFKCKYFYITHDTNSPRGCRYFNFKGPSIPSIVVKRESGKDCTGFELKERIRKENINKY